MKLNEQYLPLGVVGRPHGVMGEVKVHLFNPESSVLLNLERVFLELPTKRLESYALEHVRGGAKGYIVRFAGVAGRDGAEALKACRVLADRSELPPLEEDEYYLADLVGCAVLLKGSEIGRVKAVRADPSVDTMLIRLESGQEVEQPIVPAFVGRVDIEAKQVELSSDDGLIAP